MPFTDFLRFGASLSAGCLVLIGALTVPIPRVILQLEQARSLGNGQLASLLASPNEDVASRAALAIGRTHFAGAATLLTAHIDDPRPGVRAMSIYGLGLVGAGIDVDRIAAHANDGSSAVRVAVLDSLSRYAAANRIDVPHSYTLTTLFGDRLLSDHDPLVRGRAALALTSLARTQAGAIVPPLLVQSLDSETAPYVVQRVLWAVFRDYASSVDEKLLVHALSSHDDVERIEAVRALAKKFTATKNTQVLSLLRSRAENDSSWRVQEEARNAMRAVGSEPAVLDWKAIPNDVHIAPMQRDPYASLQAVPWPDASASPAPPSPMNADLGSYAAPQTAQQMLSPAPGAHPRLRIVTTKGNVYFALFPEWAPLTVQNFLNLAARGFYDDNRWFRIVPDFVVQTGEKDDKNAPGPGYTIGAEQNPLEQDEYVLSMGLNYDKTGTAPQLDSAGSEYYVTLSPQYHLDNDFTVFGRVVSGFDVLSRLIESDRVIRIERVADMLL